MSLRLQMVLIFCGVAAVGGGCSTVPDRYIPQTVGNLQDSSESEGVKINISSKYDIIPRGQPVTFVVTIRNVGSIPILLPKKPMVMFTWTYPNGRRDNFMQEYEIERFYTPSELVLLKPNASLVHEKKIETYYFDYFGITEFRAVLHVASNTNPAVKCWGGHIDSNGYGVLVEPKKKFSFARLNSDGFAR